MARGSVSHQKHVWLNRWRRRLQCKKKNNKAWAKDSPGQSKMTNQMVDALQNDDVAMNVVSHWWGLMKLSREDAPPSHGSQSNASSTNGGDGGGGSRSIKSRVEKHQAPDATSGGDHAVTQQATYAQPNFARVRPCRPRWASVSLQGRHVFMNDAEEEVRGGAALCICTQRRFGCAAWLTFLSHCWVARPLHDHYQQHRR